MEESLTDEEIRRFAEACADPDNVDARLAMRAAGAPGPPPEPQFWPLHRLATAGVPDPLLRARATKAKAAGGIGPKRSTHSAATSSTS